MGKEFDVIFIEDAKVDYQKLDGSQKKLIDIALAKMKSRANVLGEELTKKGDTNLIGCRRIKFRKIGIRIVFRIVGNQAEIAEIIAIGKRQKDEVYKKATKRLRNTE